MSFPGMNPNPDPATYSLWSMNPSTNSWNQKDVTTSNLTNRPSMGAWAEAPDLGLAFFYNGQIGGGSSTDTGWLRGGSATLHLPGMVVMNTASQTAQNYSTHASSGDFPVTGGGAAYIADVGPLGILITMGGMAKPAGKADASGNGNYTSMSIVNVSDVNSIKNGSGDVWYRQNTTGDIPAPQGEFCLVAYSTPDEKTHAIHLYGGRSVIGTNETVFDDVYALSLPGFVWTRLFGPGASARYGHTCHAVGGRQMITIGGVNRYQLTSQTYLNTGTAACDWEYAGVGIMDLSSAQWGSVFNATVDSYTLNSKISSATANNTMKAPVAGFDTIGLANLMGRDISAVAPWGLPSHTDSSSNRPAVIGGAVGGAIGGLLLLGSFILSWMKRKKLWYEKRTSDSSESNDNEEIELEEQHDAAQAQQGGPQPPPPTQP